MEIELDNITTPTHEIGGGGNGKAQEIQDFVLAELEAEKTNVADSEVAAAVDMPLTKESYKNIRNHTNKMRLSGLFKWSGTVKSGEHKGEHLYNAGLDEKYYDKDGKPLPDKDGNIRAGQINQ